MIGASLHRLGGDRLVAGAGRFVADVRLSGMLHAAVLRSTHAHARLVSVDATRALAMPGVHAVLTAADVPAAAVIPVRVGAPPGTERYLQPAIARGVVRYVGEPVALAVADDRYVAEDALDRIEVICDPLPVCASVADALATGAPRLFPDTASNNVADVRHPDTARVESGVGTYGSRGTMTAGNAPALFWEAMRHARQAER